MKNYHHRSLDEYVETYLQQNPERIDSFLQSALEEYEVDPDESALLVALRHVVKAKGGMKAI